MTNTDAFVAHALNLRFEDIPAPVAEKAKIFLLDSLGVGIAGAGAPLTDTVRKTTLSWGTGDGVHVWGAGGLKASAPDAAFLNAFQIHGQEFDCVHEPAVVHPMAVILAALMAETETATAPVSGKELLAAITVAVDMASGLGVAVSSPIRFFRPANAGLFGATLGLSRLRGFSPEQTKGALGHALSFCSGTMQAHIEGLPSLALQVANAARAAQMAVDLVSAGIPGAQDALEGPYGYLALFEEAYDLTPVAESLGQAWRIAEVSHKPFPTGRAAHGGITLIRKLRAQGVTADNLDGLTLRAPPLIKRLVGRPRLENMSVSYARLCFQYSGAVALRHGTVTLEDFSQEALSDPVTAALGPRIHVEDDGTPDPAAFVPQIATARLKDGSTVTATIDAIYGAPADPMTHEDHLAKFHTCLAFGFGGPRPALAQQIIDRVEHIETLQDTSQLARLVAGKETPE